MFPCWTVMLYATFGTNIYARVGSVTRPCFLCERNNERTNIEIVRFLHFHIILSYFNSKHIKMYCIVSLLLDYVRCNRQYIHLRLLYTTYIQNWNFYDRKAMWKILKYTKIYANHKVSIFSLIIIHKP